MILRVNILCHITNPYLKVKKSNNKTLRRVNQLSDAEGIPPRHVCEEAIFTAQFLGYILLFTF